MDSSIDRLRQHRDHQGNALLFLVVFLVVLMSRAPLLGPGYGYEADAWRVARTARDIASTQQYSASRPPGHPLQEILYAFIWQHGPTALDGATALLTALGVAFFALTVKALNLTDGLLATGALAFTPVVWVNSTNAMDYNWALAFVLASLYFATTGRPTVAGCLLGGAMGCRLTSALMIVPLSLVALSQGDSRDQQLKKVAGLVGGAGLVGALLFVPVAMRYGRTFWAWMRLFAGFGFPSLSQAVSAATVGVWGRAGFVAVLAGIISHMLWPPMVPSTTSMPNSIGKRHVWAWLVAVLLTAAVFARLPFKSGYLIPVVPFVLLLLGRFLDRRVYVFVCCALIVSALISFDVSVADNGKSGDWSVPYYGLHGRQVLDLKKGPVFADHARRKAGVDLVAQVLSEAKRLPGRSAIVCGAWLPQVEMSLPPGQHPGAEFVYLLDADQLSSYLRRGYRIYYAPRQERFELDVYGLDLRAHGALPLIVEQGR